MICYYNHLLQNQIIIIWCMVCVHFPCQWHCPKREQEIKSVRINSNLWKSWQYWQMHQQKKLNTELRTSKIYKKSFHSAHFGKQGVLFTTQNAAGCVHVWKALNYLLEQKKTSQGICAKRKEEQPMWGAMRLIKAYIAQGVWKAVQSPFPSWAQSIRPVLTAALRQHCPHKQQPQCQGLCSHSEDKKAS